MIILKLLRYLRGTVTFLIYGRFPQRIINSCKSEKIPLWNIKPLNSTYEAESYASCYKRISNLRKDRNTKIKITCRHGLPFKIRKLRKRPGIITGLLISFFIFIQLTSRLWIINIDCESKELQKILYTSLQSVGIKKGMKTKDINCKTLSKKFMLLNDCLSWDSFNLKGCTLDIKTSIKEEKPKKEFHKNKYADIIAECDGQIIYSEIKKGQKLFDNRQTVAEGDILVSGTVKDKFGGISCVYSQGKILAICEKIFTAASPKSKVCPVPSGDKYKTLSVVISDKKYTFPKSISTDQSIKINESYFNMPVFKELCFVSETFIPVKYNSFNVNSSDAYRSLYKIIDKQINDLDALKVTSRNDKKSENEKYYFLTSHVYFIKDIAIEREF